MDDMFLYPCWLVILTQIISNGFPRKTALSSIPLSLNSPLPHPFQLFRPESPLLGLPQQVHALQSERESQVRFWVPATFP